MTDREARQGAEGPAVHEPYAAVVETHVGVVWFLGDRAFKMKKPVSLGFVDFTSREERERACRLEVELNGRLAPDVYLGVVDVIGPDGAPRDHLVEMRRLPSSRRLSVLVRGGEDVGHHVEALARLLVNFHSRAARGGEMDHAAGVAATLERWEANAARMRALARSPFDPAEIDATLALATRYLEGRAPLFESRVAEGRACDGHGDLLAEDIFCLDDGPRVLDCLEFDDRLRYGDVLADVAFLAMDLEDLGRVDLAQRLLSAYRRDAGDRWPPSLAHHHVAYRAQVRALVAGVRHAQGEDATSSATRHLVLARRHLEAARVRLVIVGGEPGAGKSTLAEDLADALDAVVLRSDELRKQLAGLPSDAAAPAAFGEGIYTRTMTDATYGLLLDEARTALSMGSSVVLDATFSDERWREAARHLAAATLSDHDELVCVAPREVREHRLETRAPSTAHGSDADVEIARRRPSRPEDEAGERLDTAGTPSAVLAAALERIGASSPA